MIHLEQQDKAVANAIRQELGRQRDTIELIASENFVSQAVMGSVREITSQFPLYEGRH